MSAKAYTNNYIFYFYLKNNNRESKVKSMK